MGKPKKSHGMRPRGIIIAALLILAALGGGCTQRNAYVPPPPPEVVVATAEQRTITLYHEYTGNTAASAAVQIRARVSGYLEKIGFQDGETVKKDQLLFVIDRRPYAAAVADAKALLESRKATVIQQESIYKRDVALLPTHAVSAEQADIDKGNLMVAKAGVGQAQASLEQAQLNLGFTEIRAPIVGHIDRHMVDVGNLVTADTTLLTTLYQWDPMWAYFTVPEVNYLEYIKRQREKLQEVPPEAATRGKPASSPATPPKSAESQHVPSAAETRNPVEVGLANETGYPHEGYIDFAQPTVEPISGTLLIRGVFANPEPYVLRAGLFVRVRVPVGTQSAALLVPDSAIGTDQAGNYLLMVGPDDVVQRRSVTSGTREGAMRVITQGVQAGEQFIVQGLQMARPGAKVQVKTQNK